MHTARKCFTGGRGKSMGKIINNVVVPKQINHAGCWAVATAALAGAVGKGFFDERTLFEKYKSKLNKAGSYKVTRALKGIDINSSELKIDDSNFSAGLEKIRASIDDGKPVVVGIKVANDALKWKDGSSFTMPHALVCFGYHEMGGGQFFFKDPARADDNRLIYNEKELKKGFVYMNISDLGPKTRSALDVKEGAGAIMMNISSAIIMD